MLPTLLLLLALALPGSSPQNARSVAVAVWSLAPSLTGDLTGSPAGDAALMVLWAHRESAFLPCVRGDSGRSVGAWQLQNYGPACDVTASAAEWLRRAEASVQLCGQNPPDERLAALASGSCDRGRALAATRVAEARALAAALSW